MDKIAKADQLMRDNEPQLAFQTYQEAWTEHSPDPDQQERVWLLLALANAAIRAGEFEEAFDALYVLPQHYSETGIVVGNPLFHLLVGLSLHGMNDNQDAQTDNFARALICGGPEIFNGEDPSHLENIQQILKPPAETGTWTGYVGCSRDQLNDSTGYIRELITKKIGSDPPYEYGD